MFPVVLEAGFLLILAKDSVVAVFMVPRKKCSDKSVKINLKQFEVGIEVKTSAGNRFYNLDILRMNEKQNLDVIYFSSWKVKTLNITESWIR